MQVKARVTALNIDDISLLAVGLLLLLLLLLRAKAVQDALGLLSGDACALGLLQAGPTKFDRLLGVVVVGLLDLWQQCVSLVLQAAVNAAGRLVLIALAAAAQAHSFAG